MQDNTKILYVDDDQNLLDTFTMALEDYGYHIKTASSSEDAIRYVSDEAFDIVFIDMYLGNTHGIDLMTDMSGMNKGLHFVIATGNGSVPLAVESLQKGASDFITKPLFASDLVRSIEYVKKKRQLEKEREELFDLLENKVKEKTDELERVFLSVLSSFAQAMEKRDYGTYGHCRRVSFYSSLIAESLEFDEKERQTLKAAAMLHDIGKIGITDFIIGKNGPLLEKEMNIIKSHSQTGVDILKPVKQFKSILPTILHHHEHYDGSGYPHGLSGEDIPLHARIIAVADTYDAIVSSRPYRSAGSHKTAIAELSRCSESQFDPVIVDAFVEAGKKYQKIVGDTQCLSDFLYAGKN